MQGRAATDPREAYGVRRIPALSRDATCIWSLEAKSTKSAGIRRTPYASRHRGAGFSLVEVMCAILILGIAMVGLVQGITTALSSGKEAELQTTAALIASGRIEKLRAEGYIDDGETGGDCGDDFPNYQWRQTITGTSVKGLHEVELVVESSQSGKQICDLRTMIFEPYVTTETEQKSDSKRAKDRRKGRKSE